MTTVPSPSLAAPTTCIETGLPTERALLQLLAGGTRPFHLVLVRLEHGAPLDAAVHLTTILRGQGALYRMDERLFAVLLPTSLAQGGQLLIEALSTVVGPPLILSAATGSWLGGCAPLQTLRDVHAELTRGHREPSAVTTPAQPEACASARHEGLSVVSLADELYG